ncbi:hypothetical protein EJB05_19383 [Eragrostis curvula]|uniref:RING-type domain-containing protein n=1 Tax=Eragrostis curvula TaxID=38414 RepID=A0A5J9UVK5_9POAL|nr:hypothetical protein EJB05_19383 [Eragrostis curvula]
MVLMAGMLPGVECARRRRVRQGGSSSGAAEAPCGTRRTSFCLYAVGHDHAHLGSSGSKERSNACKGMAPARAWTLDSNAREAKERLDQKLRSQRESVVNSNVPRRQSTGTSTPQAEATSSGRDGTNNHSSAATMVGAEEAPTTITATATGVLQREVLAANGGGRRRFSWSRLARRPAAEAAVEECAVCLEELRVGNVLVHLPCAHRFHWACAVPWVQAASRCPVCRAQVHLLASSAT